MNEDFEIKEVYTINGKGGLWKLKRIMPNANMAHFVRITTGEKTTVAVDKCIKLGNYTIYTTVGTELTVEQIIENIYTDMHKDGFPYSFDKLETHKQEGYMAKYVPDYDPDKFKAYHMRNIWKWAFEINEALLLQDEQDSSEADQSSSDETPSPPEEAK